MIRRARLAGSGLALAALLAFCGSCSDFRDPTVVTVGDRALTLRDLRQAFADRDPGERPPLDTPAARVAFVESVVEWQLLVDHGRSLLESRPEAQRTLQRERERILVARLATLWSGAAEVDRASLDSALARLGERVLVQRATMPTPEAAQAARGRVASGAGFSEAVQAEGGAVMDAPAWRAWWPHGDPTHEAAMRLRPGQVSDPVPDGGRTWLVRVLDRDVDAAPAPSEESRSRLAVGLRQTRSRERTRALTERLREQAAVRFHQTGLDLLVERTKQAILEGTPMDTDAGWALPVFTPEEELELVAEWGSSGRWTAREYGNLVQDLPQGARPRGNLRADVAATSVTAVDRLLLLEEAGRRRLEEEWWVLRTQRCAEERLLVSLARADLRGERAVTPVERAPGKTARIARFDLTSPQAALREKREIQRAGGALARIAEILDSKAALAGSYRLARVRVEDLQPRPLARALFQSPPGTLTGPHELIGQWILAECLELDPDFPPSRLQSPDGEEAITRWLELRKRESAVSVDERALDALAPGARTAG